MAWSVTPEEYRSRLLTPKSCTIAKTRKTTTNQDGNGGLVGEGEEAAGPVPTSRTKVPTAAPSVMMRISGTAVPRNTQPTMPFFDASAGQ